MSPKWQQETAGQPLPRLWCRELVRQMERERLEEAYCFPIVCLQTMIMDIQYWWHIFMMDGAAKAGEYPAAFVSLLIK